MKYCGGNVNRYGIEKQKIKCTKMECLARNSISGNWGPWSHWTDCSAKCDDGAHSRVRLCNNPAPSKYGRKCAGPAKEEAICTVGRCNPKPEDTDFDDSNRPFGMWRTAPGSQLHWRRNKEFTQTMNTGPMKDHTTGKGYYLYIESSGAHTKNKNAKVISATLTGKPGGQCFKFFYTMYGKTIGALEVALLQNGRKVKTLFYKAGDQGPNWIYGTASIDKVQGKYQIEIIGTVRDRGYSDIAIDDVYIDDGLCSCQDKYISCKSWSRKGECRKNKDWMSKNCPRSCYICRKNPIRPAGPAPAGQAGPSSPLICEDKNKDQCPLWAKQGECDKNKDYMHNNCRKSCNICKAPPCEDKEKTNCPTWAKKGECDKNKDYMHKNCQKSCKICKAEEECEDNDKYIDQCSIWVKKDECRKNKKWMETNCRKSCNACGCKDQQSGCQSWAKKGECDSNPAFMHVFCKKACGKC